MNGEMLWPEGLGPGRLVVSPTSAIVSVDAPGLASRIELAGRIFLAKREFHLTLLGRERAGQLAAAAGGTHRAAKLIRRAWRGAAPRIEAGREVWMLDEPPLASLVLECRVEGGEAFFRALSASGVLIEPPPFHVTLYLSGSGRGIGVHSVAELERLGRPLAPAEREAFFLAARGDARFAEP